MSVFTRLVLTVVFCATEVVFATPSSSTTRSISADLLYWQPRIGASENWAQVITPVGPSQQVEVLEVPFKWSPGGRVRLLNEVHDCFWDYAIEYTGYSIEGENARTAGNGKVYSAYLGNFYINNANGDNISGPVYQSGGVDWRLRFHTLDLEMGHTIQSNANIFWRPFLAIKGAVIRNQIDTRWQMPFAPSTFVPITTFSNATENLKNHFTGLGPAIGTDARFNLLKQQQHTLSLNGHFAGALLLGRWHLSDVYQNNAAQRVAVINERMTNLSSVLSGYIGLAWAIQNTWQAKLGYEEQIWLDQIRFYSFNMGRTNHLLSVHGLVLSLSIVK